MFDSCCDNKISYQCHIYIWNVGHVLCSRNIVTFAEYKSIFNTVKYPKMYLNEIKIKKGKNKTVHFLKTDTGPPGDLKSEVY